MTDVRVETEPAAERRRTGLDLWLNLALAVLVALIVGRRRLLRVLRLPRPADQLRDQRRRPSRGHAPRPGPQEPQRRRSARPPRRGARRHGQVPEATEQLNAALKIDPKHIGAYLDLGLVALAAKNPAAAESYFKKVVDLTEGSQYAALNSSRETALYNLGLIALRRSATTRRPATSRRRSDPQGRLGHVLPARQGASGHGRDRRRHRAARDRGQVRSRLR